MSDKKNKEVDPLLGGVKKETPVKIPDQKKPAEVEAEPVSVAPKKLTPLSQIKAEAVAKFPEDIIAQTKYILDNSEHISFLVPQLEGETDTEPVQINGYKLTIKKNEQVSIPVQVAAIIAEKYKINMQAGRNKRTDRASDIADALS